MLVAATGVGEVHCVLEGVFDFCISLHPITEILLTGC